tara:strand:- start:29 stop:418 length:390 start_codon:yes stop_codon:yes gene_type:complete
MTQSNKAIDTITLDLSDYPDEAFITDTGSDYTFNVSTNTNSSVISSSNLDSITTISGITGYTISSDDQISFDWDNIKIVPTLWKEALPDIYTVNNMCEEYPALAKAYENFQTVYKLVEQDYKGKKEDNT